MNLIQCNSIIAIPPIVAGFPVNGVLDDFNRADENPLAGNWTQGIQGTGDGDPKIVSTLLRQHDQGLTSMARAHYNTVFNADQEAYIGVISVETSNALYEVWLRLNNPGASNITGYMVRIHNVDKFQAFRWDSDSSVTQIMANTPATISNGDSFGASVVGTVGTVYHRIGAGAWNAVGTFDASAYTSGGQIGVGIGPDPVFPISGDNFGGGNI